MKECDRLMQILDDVTAANILNYYTQEELETIHKAIDTCTCTLGPLVKDLSDEELDKAFHEYLIDG